MDKNKANNLTGSIIWKFLERSSVQIINLVVQILLARILATEQFGSLAIILVFYNLADLIVQKGFGSALIRKDELSKADLDSVFLLSLALACICSLIIVIFSERICIYYNNNSLLWPLRVMGFSLLLSPAYCVCNSLLIREMQFKKIFIRSFCGTVISGTLAIISALKGFGLWALVIQMITNQLILTLLMCFSTKYWGGSHFSKEAFWDVFSFGKNVLITEFLLTLLESLRTLLIGKQYSTEDLAYYDRGQVYPATLMRAINDTLFSTLLPFFSKIHNDKQKLRLHFETVLYYATLIVFPTFLGLAAVSKTLICLLLTDKWIDSIIYMEIFCVYQVVFPYQIVSKAVLYAIGDSKTVLKLEIIKSLISFVLLLISIKLGVIYIAASLIVVRIISDFLYVIKLTQRFGKLSVIKTTWKQLVAATIMMVLVRTLSVPTSLFLTLLLQIFIGVVFYCCFLFLVDYKKMRQVISTTIRRFKK